MGNSSYGNIFAFVIVTILYYLIKPSLTLVTAEAAKYQETRYTYLSIYLMVIVLTQFFVNVSVIQSTCGGNIKDSVGPAALFTFMPWLFIFGIMVVVLVLYPGFKSVFADVIGYFYISSAANEIITTLLINKEVENTIEKGGEPSSGAEPPMAAEVKTNSDGLHPATNPYISSTQNSDPSSEITTDYVPTGSEVKKTNKDGSHPETNPFLSSNTNSNLNSDTSGIELTEFNKTKKKGVEPLEMGQEGGGKKELQDAAELIVKICGNMSVLINQITPENFTSYWKILTPLMKPKFGDEEDPEYVKNTDKREKLKNDLFQLVVTRDNVGESVWYIYAGILVTSIVQLKIATRGCVKNVAQMEKDYQEFQDEEAAAQAKKDQLESTTYTL